MVRLFWNWIGVGALVVTGCSDSSGADTPVAPGPSEVLQGTTADPMSTGLTGTSGGAIPGAGPATNVPASTTGSPGPAAVTLDAGGTSSPGQAAMDASPVGEQDPVPPGSGSGEGTCLQGTGDFNGDGPYATTQKDVTLGAQGPYTIFYPSPMDDGCPHPIVAWGNGTGVTGSGTYAFSQQHAASWGIVVIAAHDSDTGSGEFHKVGLDYLLEQNADPSSEFFGKLSERAGTSGHSQGGMGANQGASHPNVSAIGNVQGAFGTAPPNAAFPCLTGTEDIAIEGCKSTVNGTSMPALYANWEGGTHTGTATVGGWISGDEGSKQYRRFYTAWFRCFLADDAQACDMFRGGADCPVCKEPGWAEIFANNY